MKQSITYDRRSALCALITLLFVGVGLVTSSVWAIPIETAGALWGDFTNALKIPPATNPPVELSTSATFFGGHVKFISDTSGTPIVPSGGGYHLWQSSFGQMVAYCIPYPNFQKDALDRSKKMLYYEHGDTTAGSEYDREKAAFRYKILLYQTNADTNDVSAQFNSMDTFWGKDDLNRANDAASIVKAALKYDPQNEDLINALLDIYYDTAVAELAKASAKMVEAQKAALGPPIGPLPPPGEFCISSEIQLLNEALPLYDSAMVNYFDLFRDPIGVNVRRYDAEALEGVPFGYYIFQKQVPKRSLFAPSYKDKDGNITPLVDGSEEKGEAADGKPDELFAGYKDLVLLFTMERDAARAAAKLGRLYALRGMEGDMDKAREIIGKWQQKCYTDGTILNGIFPNIIAPNKSGLDEARASWGQGLAELTGVKSFLEGNANPLGLDLGFLALIQTDLEPDGQTTNDTYDYFAKLLIPDGLTPSASLGDAYTKYENAQNQYDKVRMNQDAVKTELGAQRTQFDDRLFQIVGEDIEDLEAYNEAFKHPEEHPGSEIAIQTQGIELAKLTIDHNEQETKNLRKEIENELERRGTEANENNLIGKTYIKYGNKQASLTEEMSYFSAAQAAASAIAAGAGTWLTSIGAGIAAGVVNAEIQTVCELEKGRIQGEKERLAAQEQAEVNVHTDNIAAANSKARVKDLMLRFSTLAIESKQAAVSLAQEVGKLQKLLDEKAHLEARRAEAREDLATRYFADPVHRMILDQYVIDSDFAFDTAQFWVFAMARALDYKWNTRVLAEYGGKTYKAETVFTLRNASELVEMAKALWNWNKVRPVGIRGGDQFVKLSLRQDIMGMKQFDVLGNKIYYPDPAGSSEMLDAQWAFQSYLRSVAKHRKSTNSGMTAFNEVIALEFSTNWTNLQGTFYSTGRWNEKIKWVQVNINTSSAPSTETTVWLEQSGAGYLRNQIPGSIDPDNSDQLIGEATTYPTQYWYQEEDPQTHNLVWRSKPTFGAAINASLVKDPDRPVESIRKTEFHEMPPAISKWILEIPIKDASGDPMLDLGSTDRLGAVTDVEIWFYNYYRTRNNKADDEGQGH